jgi:formate dehydrogenase major subunit
MITVFDPKTDIDLGTPARESDVQITLNIDGSSISVPEGTSVMRAAALLGTTIPKLCATDSLEAFGSCRMCLVEIDGMRGYPASCTTPVTEGMSVHTQTPKLATPAPQCHGALHLRSPAGLPDLLRQRQLRAANRGRPGRPAGSALRL